jgi:hypothetical protein
MFENKSQPLIAKRKFFGRLASSVSIALIITFVSLLLGMAGYHHFEKLSWMDSYLNAAMLLGGMGPVEQPQTSAGKFFAGTYAVYCGLVVITVTAILLAPVIHRIIHAFHMESSTE